MNIREEMTTLLELGAVAGAAALTRWVAELDAAAAAEADRWLTEERAARRSGHAVAWLRRRYRRWAAEGYARKVDGVRQYYAAVIPRRGLALEPADDPREQARRDAAAA